MAAEAARGIAALSLSELGQAHGVLAFSMRRGRAGPAGRADRLCALVSSFYVQRGAYPVVRACGDDPADAEAALAAWLRERGLGERALEDATLLPLPQHRLTLVVLAAPSLAVADGFEWLHRVDLHEPIGPTADPYAAVLQRKDGARLVGTGLLPGAAGCPPVPWRAVYEELVGLY